MSVEPERRKVTLRVGEASCDVTKAVTSTIFQSPVCNACVSLVTKVTLVVAGKVVMPSQVELVEP